MVCATSARLQTYLRNRKKPTRFQSHRTLKATALSKPPHSQSHRTLKASALSKPAGFHGLDRTAISLRARTTRRRRSQSLCIRSANNFKNTAALLRPQTWITAGRHAFARRSDAHQNGAMSRHSRSWQLMAKSITARSTSSSMRCAQIHSLNA